MTRILTIIAAPAAVVATVYLFQSFVYLNWFWWNHVSAESRGITGIFTLSAVAFSQVWFWTWAATK
jgi:hypothetical protein